MAELNIVRVVAVAVDVDIISGLPDEELVAISPGTAMMKTAEPYFRFVIKGGVFRNAPSLKRGQKSAIFAGPVPTAAKFTLEKRIDGMKRRPRLVTG